MKSPRMKRPRPPGAYILLTFIKMVPWPCPSLSKTLPSMSRSFVGDAKLPLPPTHRPGIKDRGGARGFLSPFTGLAGQGGDLVEPHLFSG